MTTYGRPARTQRGAAQLSGGRVLGPRPQPRPRPPPPHPGRPADSAPAPGPARTREGSRAGSAPPLLTCRAACAPACAGACDRAASGSGSPTRRGCTLNPGVGGGRGPGRGGEGEAGLRENDIIGRLIARQPENAALFPIPELLKISGLMTLFPSALISHCAALQRRFEEQRLIYQF